MKWITDKDPIKQINTHPTPEQVRLCVKNAIYSAFSHSSCPCITKITTEVDNALKQLYK